MKEDYRVNPRNIQVDQRKKDTRREGWDRDYMLADWKMSLQKSNKQISNVTQVFVFAFFYVSIYVTLSIIMYHNVSNY